MSSRLPSLNLLGTLRSARDLRSGCLLSDGIGKKRNLTGGNRENRDFCCVSPFPLFAPVKIPHYLDSSGVGRGDSLMNLRASLTRISPVRSPRLVREM